LLKKARPWAFSTRKAKSAFLLCSIFQAPTPCLKNGGASMRRTQAVSQQPAKTPALTFE
jgi:hypothetical protein